jgi:ubiquinone/menaquinone biosynthesis C-methylase UbiE
MLFNSPLSSSKANKLIDVLKLDSGSRVLDVGCGSGEFLIRTIERYKSQGFGVDTNAAFLEIARQTSRSRVSSSQIEFLQADIKEANFAPNTFDCGICIGSSHAFSMNELAYPETLKGLCRLVRPGGLLLIGESYWAREPAKEYLDSIGEPVGVYRTHFENVELAVGHGLVPLYALTSSLDEWDEFEWNHNIKMEQEFSSSAKMVEDLKRIQFSRNWRMAYLRWGRETMAFGFYIFQRPS